MPQLASRVSKTRRTWINRVEALITAGSVALDAVAARDARALLRADDAIDAACEACHHEYWYP
jgi:cytochrome c556